MLYIILAVRMVPGTLPYMVILGIRLCDWSEEGDCMIRPAKQGWYQEPYHIRSYWESDSVIGQKKGTA